MLFFKVILILPHVWLLNLGSDLSVNNIVQLDWSDTKIVSQDAVNKVLELTKKWKYSNFRGKFWLFLEIYWKYDKSLQRIGIYGSSAFYSTLLSFFVLEIFGLSWNSLFVRYFGSISRFMQFVQPWTELMFILCRYLIPNDWKQISLWMQLLQYNLITKNARVFWKIYFWVGSLLI